MSNDEFEFDLSGVTEASLERGDRVPPGKYHIEITNAVMDGEASSPCVRLRLAILAGTTPSAAGTTLEESLFLTPRALNRTKLILHRLGVIEKGHLGRKGIKVKWNDLVGRQAIAEVTEEKFTKRDGSEGVASKITYAGVWSLDDDRAKDVPRDPEAVARVGQARPRPAAVDDFSDL
jgi:hypothetical protein